MTVELAALDASVRHSRIEALRERLQHLQAQDATLQADALRALVQREARDCHARMQRYLRQAIAADAAAQPFKASAYLGKAQLWHEVGYPWQYVADIGRSQGWDAVVQWLQRQGRR